MNAPKIERQHRLSRTYLKHWGYDHNDLLCVCVFYRYNKSLEDVPIAEYTTIENEFDFPSEDEREQKHYERTAAEKVESEYDKILRTISQQKQLRPEHAFILKHLISLFICRSEAARDEFRELLSHTHFRDGFLEEIHSFNDDSQTEELKILMPLFPPKEQLRFLTGTITNYFAEVLKTFRVVVLRDFSNRGWFSSDLPVVIDRQENFNHLINPDTEIYFPLNPEYCLFLFNINASKISNPLRQLPLNKINPTNELAHDLINHKILNAAYKSLIIPKKYKSVFQEVISQEVSFSAP